MKSIFLIIVIISIYSCNKSKTELNTLPAITQTGANTFGFKVNGEIWTTNGKYCFNQYGNCRDNPSAKYYQSFGTIIYSADKVVYKGLKVTSSEMFDISIRNNFQGIGTYSLKYSDTTDLVSFTNTQSWVEYKLIPQRETFIVDVSKFDTTNKIFSGSFSGKLYNTNNLNDSIFITDGRFDIKYNN